MRMEGFLASPLSFFCDLPGALSPESTVYMSRMAKPSATTHWSSHYVNVSPFQSRATQQQSGSYSYSFMSATRASSTLGGVHAWCACVVFYVLVHW
jgi:hypothetical protein